MNEAISETDNSSPRGVFRRRVGQAMTLAIIMLASLGLYLLVLKWRGPAAALVTYSSLDDALPFRPEWVWVYLLPYVVGPLLFMLLTPATFRWYISRGLVLVLVSLAFFALVPTQTAPRPPATDLGEGWTAALYHSMIAIDEPPANAAPSLHVSLTCLLAFALARDFPRWRLAAAAGVAVVWLATLLTRQHHLLDVATGVLLTLVVMWLWPARVQARTT